MIRTCWFVAGSFKGEIAWQKDNNVKTKKLKNQSKRKSPLKRASLFSGLFAQ
jgi:hypothetical protein